MGADVNAASRKDGATGATRVGRGPTEFYFQERVSLYAHFRSFYFFLASKGCGEPGKLYQAAAIEFCTFRPLPIQKYQDDLTPLMCAVFGGCSA